MLNTKKFLYILPDAAYVAELLPTKKPHSFSIHAFRQVNGEFIDENEFIAENVDKLIKKIDPEEYQLILPDFLFTNTIVDVQFTDEDKVKSYLKDELLPSLGLSKDTHELDTFILTQHQGKSRVQLSALEKSLLEPVQKAADEQKLMVSSISPLSWTIKSVVSLEPSITVIQIGGMLYLAQHYIGVDQTISFKIEETENIVETVKTLKGAEPNIQTLYLLTNLLVENEIKEKLSGTLPIQQLANYAEEQEGIPSYIKQIIESGCKTFDIPEYPVPKFSLGKTTAKAEQPTVATTTPNTQGETPVTDTHSSLPEPTAPSSSVTAASSSAPTPAMTSTPLSVLKEEIKPAEDLPAPHVPSVAPASAPTLPTPEVKMISEEVKSAPTPLLSPSHTPEITAAASSMPVKVNEPILSSPVSSSMNTNTMAPAPTPTVTPVPTSTSSIGGNHPPSMTNTPITPTGINTAPVAPQPLITSTSAGFGSANGSGSTSSASMSARPVIKNKSGVGSLLKMVGITVGALAVTVAIGVGVGFLVLSVSEKKNNALNHAPVVLASPTASASPSPSPTSTPVASSSGTPISAAALKSKKFLIVNATGIAGKAGKVKSAMTAAGYKSVDTGNAKGTYSTAGDFLLTDNQDPDVLTTLQKDTKMTALSYAAGKSDEDPKGAYDFVIVLNDK